MAVPSSLVKALVLEGGSADVDINQRNLVMRNADLSFLALPCIFNNVYVSL